MKTIQLSDDEAQVVSDVLQAHASVLQDEVRHNRASEEEEKELTILNNVIAELNATQS